MYAVCCCSTEVYLVPRDPAVVFVIFFNLSLFVSHSVFFFTKKNPPFHYVMLANLCVSSNTLCSNKFLLVFANQPLLMERVVSLVGCVGNMSRILCVFFFLGGGCFLSTLTML